MNKLTHGIEVEHLSLSDIQDEPELLQLIEDTRARKDANLRVRVKQLSYPTGKGVLELVEKE